MLKIVGVSEDKFKVLDTDDNDVSLATAETLVLALADGVEFEGCEYGPKGLKVWFEGQEPYDVDVEVWKPVVYRRKYDGFLLISDKYVVSNLGRVKSLERIDTNGHFVKERILKQYRHRYMSVGLCVADGSRHFSVHVLVALAYLPNSNNFPIINHKDENQVNNSAYNLEWCTYLYNNTYGSHMERIILANSDSVRQYSHRGEFIREFANAVEAAKFCGCSVKTIRSCCSGRQSSAHNFIWRYSASDELFVLSEDYRADVISSQGHICFRGVRQYSISGDFIAEYASLKDASSASGATANSICGCLRGWSRTSHGYIWRYIVDDDLADRPENTKAIEEFRKLRGSYNGGSLETS